MHLATGCSESQRKVEEYGPSVSEILEFKTSDRGEE